MAFVELKCSEDILLFLGEGCLYISPNNWYSTWNIIVHTFRVIFLFWKTETDSVNYANFGDIKTLAQFLKNLIMKFLPFFEIASATPKCVGVWLPKSLDVLILAQW